MPQYSEINFKKRLTKKYRYTANDNSVSPFATNLSMGLSRLDNGKLMELFKLAKKECEFRQINVME